MSLALNPGGKIMATKGNCDGISEGFEIHGTAGRQLVGRSRGMVCLILGMAALSGTILHAGEVGQNMALGRPYRLFPAPNYPHCTDPGDTVQLTDGQTTDRYFWTQIGTVGWQNVHYASITVDLGRVEPIGGVSMTTAAGTANVTWPMAVQILVSDDGQQFYNVGDLVALDHEVNGPWPEGYAIRRLSTDRLEARGRYVKFVLIPLPGGPYLFTDEVEVFRGPDSFKALRFQPETATTAERVYREGRLERSVSYRWEADLRSLERVIEEAPLAPEQRAAFREAREDLRAGGPDPIEDPEDFRAVLPLGERHARLFRTQAGVWRAAGQESLRAWVGQPYDPLDPFAPPAVAGDEALDDALQVDAMRGERRSGVVNLANATDEPLEVRLRFADLPQSPRPDYVQVHQVKWTDTARGVPVASALPAARTDGDGWRVTVRPGLVRQVWFAFRFQDEPPGRHSGELVIEAAGQPALRLPVHLQIRPFEMPSDPRLLLGGWSYTDGSGRYGLTSANREAFLEHLQTRYVNAPWATSGTLMRFEFDAQDPAQITLDTRQLDDWIDQWPDARMYLVFLAVAHHSGPIRTSLGGADIDSPEFDQRVATWISAWVRHLRSRDIAPHRLGLLIHDEPHEGSDIQPLLRWARAIRAAEPDVVIWEDPTYRNPAAAPAELFEACDVLCPNRPMWLAGGQAFADFYRQQQRQGRQLHFYSCSGPAKLLDPYSYYRLQAWHIWQEGGDGSFFWAFGDNSGSSSWNEYLARSGPYTPLFLDDDSVTAGKQMEAIAESVQDFALLDLLRAAVDAADPAERDAPPVGRGRQLLEQAVPRVLQAEGADGLNWHDAKDRAVADRVRSEILDVLTELTHLPL